MSDLAQPCVLNLSRKRLVLQNMRAHFANHYPDTSADTCALLTDIEHDLRRADAAEREITALKLSAARTRGAETKRGIAA